MLHARSPKLPALSPMILTPGPLLVERRGNGRDRVLFGPLSAPSGERRESGEMGAKPGSMPGAPCFAP